MPNIELPKLPVKYLTIPDTGVMKVTAVNQGVVVCEAGREFDGEATEPLVVNGIPYAISMRVEHISVEGRLYRQVGDWGLPVMKNQYIKRTDKPIGLNEPTESGKSKILDSVVGTTVLFVNTAEGRSLVAEGKLYGAAQLLDSRITLAQRARDAYTEAQEAVEDARAQWEVAAKEATRATEGAAIAVLTGERA